MAHSLGLKVVAEGVETEDQLAYLLEVGCDWVQGYLLARPAPLQALRSPAASLSMAGSAGSGRG